MCGFIGKISNIEIDYELISKSNDYLICRGPDSTKKYKKINRNKNIFLIFNRLSVVDLSDKANQPMHNENEMSSIVFNGEIFNHKELRINLEKSGVKFSTDHSDSEVVLKGLSKYGINFVDQLRGQFSICYIDYELNKAYLISDRLNQKPLYYQITKDSLLFSSNLISLVKSLPSYNLSDKSIYEYLEYGIVSSPNTIFERVKKLIPAQIIEVDFSQSNFKSHSKIYWRPNDFVADKPFDETIFYQKLDESISIRLDADVPIANFLSGGIDSTSIIKNMYDSDRSINSFSVVFDEEKYNEQKWSREVANKYSTNHFEMNASSKVSINEIDNSLKSLDEPYSDPSVVPSFLISKAISEHYKVAISGDGGDELLGGYKRTNILLNNRNEISNLISKMYKYYPSYLGTGNYFLSKSKNLNLAYTSFFRDSNLLHILKLQESNSKENIKLDYNLDLLKSLIIQDYRYYLPEMMLLKIDRTSMANSLEIRSPFVDHKLIEYVLSTKLDKEGLNFNKNVLKKYLLKDFSNEFVSREKKGFVFDLEKWVFSNLEFLEDIINSGSYVRNFNNEILSKLTVYKSRMNANRIWRIFVLEHYLSRI